MKPRLNLLVVAYDFPPSVRIGGKRPASFCRYLPEHGIRPIVLTLDPVYYEACDETLTLPSQTQIERTGMLPNPLEWLASMKRSLRSSSSNPKAVEPTDVKKNAKGTSSMFLRRNILSLFGCYQVYWRWYPQAAWRGKRLVRRESVSTIFSTAPPWAAHLVARRIKLKYDLPWIADFRDFWAYDIWGPQNAPRWVDTLSRKLEADCMRDADLVICNTNHMRNIFARRYPELPPSKFVLLPNGYDDASLIPQTALENPTATSDQETPGQTQKLLLHLGDLYSGRRVDTLCQAISGLIETGNLDKRTIKIRFQGDAAPAIVSAAERATPELIRDGCIEFRPRISWQEGQQLLERADVLLIMQGNNPAIPAKFYEYLRTGKTIFAVVQQGPLTEILEGTQSGLWADPRNPADIAAKLKQALGRPRRLPEEVRQVASKFHYKHLTEQLAKWAWSLASEHANREKSG